MTPWSECGETKSFYLYFFTVISLMDLLTHVCQCVYHDHTSAIPVHMCNGIWGLLSTGLLAEPQLMLKAYGTNAYPGLFYGLASKSPNTGNLFGCQITAITFILGWVVVTMLPFFIWLNYKGWLRSEALEEIVGLGMFEERKNKKQDLPLYCFTFVLVTNYLITYIILLFSLLFVSRYIVSR